MIIITTQPLDESSPAQERGRLDIDYLNLPVGIDHWLFQVCALIIGGDETPVRILACLNSGDDENRFIAFDMTSGAMRMQIQHNFTSQIAAILDQSSFHSC